MKPRAPTMRAAPPTRATLVARMGIRRGWEGARIAVTAWTCEIAKASGIPEAHRPRRGDQDQAVDTRASSPGLKPEATTAQSPPSRTPGRNITAQSHGLETS